MTRDFAKKTRQPATSSRSTRNDSRSSGRNTGRNNSRNNSRNNGQSSSRASNARKRPAATKSKSQVPGWIWLFTGTLLGAFIMFLAYLSGVAPQPAPTQPVVAASQPDKTKTQVPKPRFDFYELLKESEVVVTEPTAPSKQVQPAKVTSDEEYILQVGSFKKSDDADRLRAQLILMNLEAQVETVTVRNGETWHRVLVGPYQSQSKVDMARSTLVSNDISPLVLKRKKS